MGLNEGQGRSNYLSVSDGKIAKRTNEDDPKAVKQTNKEGKVRYERHYKSIDGKVVGIEKKATPYGDRLAITIKDGEDYILEMPYDSRYAGSFIKCIPNIDFSKKLTFNPWMKEVTENGQVKKRTALFLKHEGSEDNIPSAFTREAPNGMPELEQVTFKGKTEWDNTKQLAFFDQLLVRANAMIDAANKGITPQPKSFFKEESSDLPSKEEESEDAPF